MSATRLRSANSASRTRPRAPATPAGQEYDRGMRDMADTGNLDNRRIEGKLDALAGEVQAVKVLVAGMMPRSEVDAEIAKRVAQEVYTADQRATNERLIRLESSPARLLAWLSGGIGCLGVLLSTSSLVFFILEFTLTHYKP